jgi:predicted alpha/beta hydrolase family esterase
VRSFLILHGWTGSGPEHWQTWLAARLRARGETVSSPALPDADHPRPEAWLAALAAALERLPPRPVVLCHSLGCILWLHHAALHQEDIVERVLLVAPPCESAGVPELAPFFPAPLTPVAGRGARLVCSDDDPYCPEGAADRYAALGAPVDLLPGTGHLNTDAGFGPWPAVEAWALGARDDVQADRVAASGSGAKNGVDT